MVDVYMHILVCLYTYMCVYTFGKHSNDRLVSKYSKVNTIFPHGGPKINGPKHQQLSCVIVLRNMYWVHPFYPFRADREACISTAVGFFHGSGIRAFHLCWLQVQQNKNWILSTNSHGRAKRDVPQSRAANIYWSLFIRWRSASKSVFVGTLYFRIHIFNLLAWKRFNSVLSLST